MTRPLSRLLRRAFQGPDGLSATGRLAARVGRHLQFLTRQISEEARFARPPVVPAPGWSAKAQGALVYDFGANHGANLPYHLRQGFRVVAVEANPALAKALAARHADDPRVTVVSACLVPTARDGTVPFWLHRDLDKLGTMVPPDDPAAFERIDLATITPEALFAAHGDPFYVKIDLEGADAAILRAIVESGRKVPYLSVEVHDPEPMAWLMAAGYTDFKIVEGRYAHLPHYTLPARVDAPAHAFAEGETAGPFGEDIPGDWMSAQKVLSYLMKTGHGWKDVHARGRV